VPLPARARIQHTLATTTEPVTTRRLAELDGVAPPSAARILRALEDDGTVLRQLHPGGCYAWTVTPCGAPTPPG
jgi:DNA-binding IscR family transcriptional regulator